MAKVAGILIIIALGLLLASLVPWSIGADETALAQPAEVDLTIAAEQGRALFLAKGCATCHAHAAAGDSGFSTTVRYSDQLARA